MKNIDSINNKSIKWLKKLINDSKQRKQEKLVVIETKKIFQTILDLKYKNFTSIFVSKSFFINNQNLIKDYLEITNLVNDTLFAKISSLKSPDGIIAVFKPKIKEISINQKLNYFGVVNLQNPHNLGAIVRSSLAFNIGGLFIIGNCVDFYHPEVIRSSMGYIFQIPIMYFKSFGLFFSFIKKFNLCLIALANNKQAYNLQTIKNKFNNCFLIGNEGNGLEQKVIKQCSKIIKIPITNVESLNVASVASVVAFYLNNENN